MNLAAYVSGELVGEGAKQHAQVHLTSAFSGHRIATASFVGATDKITGDVAQKLWTRFGPTITRACTSATKPRAQGREPLRIDAGDPLD
jgi:hypothetical protein